MICWSEKPADENEKLFGRPAVLGSSVVLSVRFHHVDGMSCKFECQVWSKNGYRSSSDDKCDLPNSPLSLTTLPLCCVVTIDAQSTKTNKRAILTQIQNFFLSLSSNTSLIAPNPSSRGSKLHLTFTAHFARCSFFSGLPFVSQSCITDRKKTFAFNETTTFSATVAERTNHEAREFNSKAV